MAAVERGRAAQIGGTIRARPLAVVARDGHRLPYAIRGAAGAALVVLIHPAFGDHTCFTPQLDALAAHYRVVAVGAQERALLRAVAKDWHRREAGSVLEIIPNTGHCANMDNPGVYNEQLLSFLRMQHNAL